MCSPCTFLPDFNKSLYGLCFANVLKGFLNLHKTHRIFTMCLASIDDTAQFFNLILREMTHIPASICTANPYCKVLQHLPTTFTMHNFRVKLQGINLAFRIRNRAIMRISRLCKLSKSLRDRFYLVRVAHPHDRILLHAFKK